ncbi:vesicle transport protein GOT1A isoform X1 [Heterocephalus glaber]|uniref:Vesicle transport protein GOT1A isoform X1 n=1 Tax=Heterocephalus glaber TaxID=10181 RepID=A0AAX6RPQ5_HETGA|nr:vesicle transport protein GOT1A isoform X1 [Heterocephalus glaber]
MISISEGQKIGVGITGFGVFFILFGTLLYFDSVLLAFGNLLFLTGLSFIIGLRRTFSFFFQRHKLKATSFFLGGVALVLLRWPFLGMLLETYGFFSLFKTLGLLRTPARSHRCPLSGLSWVLGESETLRQTEVAPGKGDARACGSANVGMASSNRPRPEPSRSGAAHLRRG